MEVADKAVSTEDLCSKSTAEVPTLETLLKILVQNKVNSIQNNDRKCSSIFSSPRSVVNRWRLTSSSTVSSKEKETLSLNEQFYNHRSPCRRKKKLCYSSEESDSKEYKRSKRTNRSGYQEENPSKCSCSDNAFQFLPPEENFRQEITYPPVYNQDVVWCCQNDINGDIKANNYNEEYVSLKIEECENTGDRTKLDRQRMKKRRKKRRKKHRMMRMQQDRIRKITVPIPNEDLKDLDPDDDELPPRARWTIVVTAFLLLFMCLLLVGVTLRMAPIIDDMGDRIEILCDGEIPFADEPSKPRRNVIRHVSDRSANRPRRDLYVRDRPKVFRSVSMLEETANPYYGQRLSVVRRDLFHFERNGRSSRRSRQSVRSNRSNRSSTRNSFERTRSSRSSRSTRRGSNSDRGRKSSCPSRKSISVYQENVSIKDRKRRRIVVSLIIITFLFILLCSVTSVVVTLTHRSYLKSENETVPYYTFSPSAKVLKLKENKTVLITENNS